jgi:hypothetical protein
MVVYVWSWEARDFVSEPSGVFASELSGGLLIVLWFMYLSVLVELCHVGHLNMDANVCMLSYDSSLDYSYYGVWAVDTMLSLHGSDEASYSMVEYLCLVVWNDSVGN